MSLFGKSDNNAKSRSVRRFHFPSLPQDEHDNEFALGGADLGVIQQEQQQALLEQERQEYLDRGYAEGFNKGVEQGKEKGLQEGKAQGVAFGRQEAINQTKKELAPVIEPMEQLTQAMQSVIAERLDDQKESICKLVKQICEQVLRAEISLHPSQILRLIEDSLALIPKPHGTINVYLDGNTLKLIKELEPERLQSWGLLADESLAPGSFRIQTDHAEAQSNLEDRVEQSVEQLRAGLEQHNQNRMANNLFDDPDMQQPVAQAAGFDDILHQALEQERGENLDLPPEVQIHEDDLRP